MDRRKFLERTASTVFATGLAAKLRLAAAGGGPLTETQKRKRLGVCSWSLHAYFPKTRPQDFKWPGKLLDLREYAELMADRYHIHNLELCNSHFESTEASYIKDLKASIQRTHSRVTNMPVDYEADWRGVGLCDPDDKQFRVEIAERKKWIDIAAELGAQSIRPNPGGTTKMTDFSRPIAAYKELGEYGKSKGVKVLIENHGNVAAKAENIVAIIKGAGPKWVGAAPDFGNFPEAERYHGLELMFPYASVVCHARYETPGGAEMSGKLIQFDFARCMKIAQASGFKGVYSAEFAGDGDPYEGIQKILDELVKYL
jgi:sugar phosphate isomerase/epimerase